MILGCVCGWEGEESECEIRDQIDHEVWMCPSCRKIVYSQKTAAKKEQPDESQKEGE